MRIDNVELGSALNLRDIQLEELKILECFADFCESHNLRYYLSGGTLLGAVRHRGFIPWDDDIDVNMPRPDYEKFCCLAKDGIGNYKLINSSVSHFVKVSNPNIILEVATSDVNETKKYTNLYIDICPLDGLPSSRIKFKMHSLWIEILTGMKGTLQFGIYGKNAKKVFRTITYPLAKLIGIKRISSLIEKSAKSYDFASSEYIGAIVTRNRMKDYLPKEHYLPQTSIEFEGKSFKTTQMYKDHLLLLYGENYMTPPSIEKRKGEHSSCGWYLINQNE